MQDIGESKEVTKVTRRGFEAEDARWFSKASIGTLKMAQDELEWLLNRGYKTAPIIDLVGGHYQLSSRQRIALMRSTASHEQILKREGNQLGTQGVKNGCLSIDGFNLIINLEVALSGSVLLLGNDGVLRDLAGLRGTYKIIDKTNRALELIADTLKLLRIQKVKIFLDAPVSNSGRLKVKILEIFSNSPVQCEVELVSNPDKILTNLENVVTGDSAILDECRSWVNLSRYIVERSIRDAWIVDFRQHK